MSVVPFRRAATPATPAVMPSPAEVEEALRAVRQAIVALGTTDLADLGARILAAQEEEKDADLDTSAEATWHLRSAEAHALFIAAGFLKTFTTVFGLRAQLEGGGDAAF